MEVDFKIIVITPENVLEDEVERIVALLESNTVWRVHIRHPQMSSENVANVLKKIPTRFYSQISLHDNYNLVKNFRGLGIHLNQRNQDLIQSASILSRSCHSIFELERETRNLDYVTLSPIFDSISKTGYHAAFDLNDQNFRSIVKSHNVFALGGITPSKFSLLRDIGFSGAVMLGYVWRHDYSDFLQSINEIKKHKQLLCYNS
jgi:thiamine-phosphate pyrophosphorylase